MIQATIAAPFTTVTVCLGASGPETSPDEAAQAPARYYNRLVDALTLQELASLLAFLEATNTK